jgi:hypothetical protein
MFTQKQLKGIAFCGIGLLSLIFSIVEFASRHGSSTYGCIFLLAALTFAAIGLFDVVTFPVVTPVKRAPQQNYYPQNQAPCNPQNQPPCPPQQNNNDNNPNQ